MTSCITLETLDVCLTSAVLLLSGPEAPRECLNVKRNIGTSTHRFLSIYGLETAPADMCMHLFDYCAHIVIQIIFYM